MSSAGVGGGQPGILHQYTNKLAAFEYTSSTNTRKKPHSLLFIGGLGDGFFTVPFVADLAAALEPTDWSLFSVLLSSSYTAWGLGSLGRDVEEIAQCVQYVQKYKESQLGEQSGPKKIVIMGHSTGSQDVLHYLYSPNPLPFNPEFEDGLRHITRPAVDGAILQAPVSDREAVAEGQINGTEKLSGNEFATSFLQLVDMARRVTYADGNKMDVLLPLNMTAKLGYPPDVPISARRFLSLTSPDSPENPREDDLFSSDLPDKRLQETFGMIATRDLLRSKLLVLYSGNDQYCPEKVDKEELLRRWKAATNKTIREVWDDEHSGVIPGATHNLEGEGEAEARRDLVSRVMGYLNDVEKLS
ncbi:hypothetical protein VTN77DRAFT_5779 [Rasamsonia byssochlamydoides]|uniref:uncharacterized protein n=1 Tax=Rasamsonia byssochlamydoides TaxID=89139 RepID=UPI0037446701